MKKTTLVLFATLSLILCINTLVYAYTGTTTFTVSTGIYPQGDYTVYYEGSTFYAKNIHGVNEVQGTNATTIIQYALQNGKETVITQGTYPIDRNVLTIPSDHILRGMGAASILQLKTYADAGSVETIILRNQHHTTGDSNILIENLAFDGNNQPSAITSGYPIAIYFRKVHNFTLRTLYFYRELSNGIRLGEAFAIYGNMGCSFGLVDNCHFTNGIGANGYGGAIYMLDHTEYVTVRNCKVVNVNRTIMIEGSADHAVENIVIEKNFICNVSYMYGLGARYGNHILFENNIIDSQGDRDGLPLDHAHNITIKGGIIRNSVSEGIKVYNNSTHVKICSVEVNNHASHGIQIWDFQYVLCTNSIVCENGGYGFRVGGNSDIIGMGYCIFDENSSGDTVQDDSGGSNYFHDYWSGSSWVS